jgi:hypothetical protein
MSALVASKIRGPEHAEHCDQGEVVRVNRRMCGRQQGLELEM